MFLPDSSGGELVAYRGTYTTSEGTITIRITQISDSGIRTMELDKILKLEPSATGWYSRDQLITAAKKRSVSDENLSRLTALFRPRPGTYSVSGNTLTMKEEGRPSITYTRRN